MIFAFVYYYLYFVRGAHATVYGGAVFWAVRETADAGESAAFIVF